MPASTPFIDRLKLIVLFSTLIFAGLQSIPTSSFTLAANLFFMSPFHSFVSDLVRAPLSMLTLGYSSICLQMLFDFLVLNFFLPPLSSFVFSFLGTRSFLTFIIAGSFVQSILLHAGSEFFDLAFLPTTLFGPTVLSVLTLWALLNTKNTTTHFLLFPIKSSTLLIVSFVACAWSSFYASDWLKVGTLVGALLYGYVTALLFFRIRSDLPLLAWFENALTGFSIQCEKLMWRLKRR